jgi:Na+-driven multidrug efflux pump
VQLLRVLSLSGLFIAVALTYTGGLQGTGDTRSPLYISIISQIVVPLGTCFVIQQTSTLDPIDIWIAILAGHATRCLLSVLRFKQGRWRMIAVNIDSRKTVEPTRSEPRVSSDLSSGHVTSSRPDSS